jgi:nickel-dependent lactate racemase
VGFSGGHKYLFPGIAGDEIINFFHWLGAIITNPVINGCKWTPTRKVVEKAASLIDIPHALVAIVAVDGKLKGLFLGDCLEAWEKAADLSNDVHIIYKDRPYHTILGLCPQMYDDIWTAGKVMYKLEPIVADGGTLIIYAPHISEVSYTHGKVLDRIGYHVRDYFIKQMDKFKDIPRSSMAHSTHVRGCGTYENGVEKPRVNVVFATGIEGVATDLRLHEPRPQNRRLRKPRARRVLVSPRRRNPPPVTGSARVGWVSACGISADFADFRRFDLGQSGKSAQTTSGFCVPERVLFDEQPCNLTMACSICKI